MSAAEDEQRRAWEMERLDLCCVASEGNSAERTRQNAERTRQDAGRQAVCSQQSARQTINITTLNSIARLAVR